MSNEKPKFSVAIRSDAYQKLINSTLGDPNVAKQFVAEISTAVANNPNLSQCDAGSIVAAGLTAASLKLSINQTLGNAYIIPYGNKAQFQIGYRGLVQLAMRSGQFSRIGVKPVHDGEPQGLDEFGDEVIKFDHDCDNNPVVGYFAYFELINGFKKTLYWTKAQCEAHGHKYSKSYNKLWGDPASFDTMASKTVLKMLLKYAPMSVEMETAVKFDQSVINDNGEPEYVDNPNNDKKTKREGLKAPYTENVLKQDNSSEDGVIDLPLAESAEKDPKNAEYDYLDENQPF